MRREANKIKRERGITLVALVITIVIIVILASVTISATFGENGIIKKAELARELATNSTIKENEDMNSLMNEYTNIMNGDGGIPDPPADTTPPTVAIQVGEVTETSIAITVNATDDSGEVASYKYYLNGEEQKTDTANTYTFTGLTAGTEYEIKVEAFDKVGNKGEGTVKLSTLKEHGDGAGEISKNPSAYYGAEVRGYTCTSKGVNKWRIFYADSTNIYLIADDYVSYQYIPDGVSIDRYNDYSFTDNTKAEDYPDGASWIKTNGKAKKWLSEYLNVIPTSSNRNIGSVAYMLDTNVWNIYAGVDAEYAIASPTIELFCASYKDTHPNKYIDYKVGEIGYQVKWNTDSRYQEVGIEYLQRDEFNGIYIKSDDSKAWAMYLASPHNFSDSHVMNVHSNGDLGTDDSYSGFRPIVCLKSEIQLEKQSDGIYSIKN